MKNEIYVTLAAPLRELVDQVEAAAGFEIQVSSRSARKHHVGDAGDGNVGVIPSAHSAVIEHNCTLGEITQDDYAHELLHLHRWFVEGVPHLVSKKQIDGDAASGLENWLEHVVIYKRQLELSEPFRANIEPEMMKAWTTHPWNLSGFNLKFHSRIKYLITRLYGSTDAKKLMRSALQNDKSLFRVRSDAEMALKAITDKRSYTAVVFKQCGIPSTSFLLRYYHPKSRRHEDLPI